MDWTDMLLGEPDEPELHVVRLRLSILAAEMASYVADKREPAPRLESMRAVANRCEVPTRELDALALVEAKLHRLLGNVDDEAEALDTCSPEMRHTAEFGFRAISFVLKTGDASLLSSVPTPTVHDDDSLTDHMAVGNIIGDRGRLMLRDENVEDAYHELVRAFRIARRTFHRRGLFVAAMRLADIALRLGEAQLAAEWWMIGDQFSSVGRHLELSREPLRRRVLTAGGPHVFSSVRRDLRSLWSAFEPIVPNTPRETAEPRSADRDRTAL